MLPVLVCGGLLLLVPGCLAPAAILLPAGGRVLVNAVLEALWTVVG